MAQQKVNGNAIYFGDIRKQPNKGVIRFGGNVADTTKWDSRSLQKNPVSSDYNIKVANTTGAFKPLAGGTFLYMAQGKYIIRRVSNTISGVANTVLLSGAAFPTNHGMHPNVHVRGTILTALQWSRSAGHDLPVYTATVDNVETTFNADNETTPTITLAVPGELTYKSSKITPVNDDYKAKTNG